jgi:hypothetical protein
MASIDKILDMMRRNPKGVRYADLKKVCDDFFGRPRNNGTSHHIYRTPWEGAPYVNIQPGHDGQAKPYQVRQVLAAIDRMTR